MSAGEIELIREIASGCGLLILVWLMVKYTT